ncbi:MULTISPECIES: hypothetical protein [unclassified Streptomyces]|uniref:hypothetical protein n=1 Tax=unclassified Streptomyces TaxID=2593676 RepID=UPI003796B30B
MQESYSSNESSDANLAALAGESISGKSAEEVEQMVERVENSATNWQEWESLRVLSDGRMRDDRRDVETRLRWVQLALVACRRKRESVEFNSANILTDEVNVRAYAIREFGAVQGDRIRDPHELCRVVFREIGASQEQISIEATDWRSLPRERMLRLRYVKNLLTPLRSMMGVLPENDPLRRQLSAWLSLIPNLP